MKLKRRTRRKEARIEIVPLIDIMFFLLATFVVVSTAMIKNRGISVNLPSSETAESAAREDYASISITEQGQYFFNKESVSPAELETKLAELKNSAQDPKVFLNGDKKAQIESLVTAIDAARRVGITKIGLETTVPQ